MVGEKKTSENKVSYIIVLQVFSQTHSSIWLVREIQPPPASPTGPTSRRSSWTDLGSRADSVAASGTEGHKDLRSHNPPPK